jgi:hypothetical protein
MRLFLGIGLGIVWLSAVKAVDLREIAGTHSLQSHTEADGTPSKCDCRFKSEVIRIDAGGNFIRENRKGYLSPRYQYEAGQCTISETSSREGFLTCCTTQASSGDLKKTVPFESVCGVLSERSGTCEEYSFRIRSLRRRDGKDWFSRWPDQGK